MPTSLQKQNLITDTLLTLLASDHVFLIRLKSVDEVVGNLPGNQGSATMTYVMQKSSDTVAISTVGLVVKPQWSVRALETTQLALACNACVMLPSHGTVKMCSSWDAERGTVMLHSKQPYKVSGVQALQLALGQATTSGSQQRSAFTTALASHNINATATVLSDSSQEDDSIQDQIYLLTTTPEANGHLGAIIGSSVGAGVALLLLATAFVVFGRSCLHNRRLKKQTAACNKVMDCSTRRGCKLLLQ